MPKSILLVDDYENILEIYSQILERQGYQVLKAENGFKALDIVVNKKIIPDLIICDIIMPEMDGYELANKFSTINPIKNIPIIFFTAKDDIKKLGQTKNSDKVHILKPGNLAELLQTVSEIFNNA